MFREPSDREQASASEQRILHQNGGLRVAVVTPAYNEQANLRRVGASIVAQTVRPSLWVIVDDESSDGTLDEAKKLAQATSWIRVLSKKREPGRYDASFKAFSFGVRAIESNWHYLMKLDADTILPRDFIERLVRKFESDSSIGIGSGVCAGESGISSHPRGNNRMYRRDCWTEIRFPEDGLGWDTVDEVFATLNGWRAVAFTDLVCEHMRSKLPDEAYRFHQGRLSRHVGYYWWFAVGRAVKMLSSFGLLPALAYLAGYVRGGLGVVDDSVKRAVRTDQGRRIASLIGWGGGAVRARTYLVRSDGSDPLITIGMPVLNRARYLPKTLDALFNCGYPRNKTRLVFVDGYSTDGTLEMLRDFEQSHKNEYRDITLIQDSGHIPAARNLCLKNIGDSELLIFLDSDVLPAPDFISRLIGLSQVGGIASIFYSSFSYERPKPAVKFVHTVGMGCTLIKREVLDRVGLFDTTLPVNEDTDYCLRARKLGYDVVQDTTVQLLHLDEGRYGPEQTLKQSFKYRRAYARIFGLGIYRKRLALYATLDLMVVSGILVHPLFFVAIPAYFIAQLVRRRGLKLSVYLTLNSLIIAPFALIGLVERAVAPPEQESRG